MRLLVSSGFKQLCCIPWRGRLLELFLQCNKLMYLTCVLQLSIADLASRSRLLALSFKDRIGPRSEFIYRSKGISPDMLLVQSGWSSYVNSLSDAKFAAKFKHLLTNPPSKYDEVFKHNWQQRWTFLRVRWGCLLPTFLLAELCYLPLCPIL